MSALVGSVFLFVCALAVWDTIYAAYGRLRNTWRKHG